MTYFMQHIKSKGKISFICLDKSEPKINSKWMEKPKTYEKEKKKIYYVWTRNHDNVDQVRYSRKS